jgi:hypothetical protein
MKTHPYK